MKLTVIIPNYNGKHFLQPCLDTLKKQTFQDFQILVVDNASTDGSVEFLQDCYPYVQTLSLEKNYGFSRAVNEGIRKATTPYVLLLNNDTKATPTFVENLLKAIERSPKIFSVSSKMLQLSYPDKIDSAGDLYTLIGWGVCRGAGRSAKLYTKPEPVFSACAGAAIYRRCVFDEIGCFDEAHFAYLEDVDVGFRGQIYGYRNLYCPTAVVYHVGSGTSGSKYNAFKVRLSARNNIWVNYKNLPLFFLLLNALPLCLGTLIKYCFFLKKGFGKDYRQGVKEAFASLSSVRKVPFSISHLPAYVAIELALIGNTFRYAADWIQRHRQSPTTKR